MQYAGWEKAAYRSYPKTRQKKTALMIAPTLTTTALTTDRGDALATGAPA